MADIQELLKNRGSEYGDFKSHAEITQNLKLTLTLFMERRAKILAADQQEALDMIFHKIGRIANGNPANIDSWADIAGYAKLVADRLEADLAFMKASPIQVPSAAFNTINDYKIPPAPPMPVHASQDVEEPIKQSA